MSPKCLGLCADSQTGVMLGLSWSSGHGDHSLLPSHLFESGSSNPKELVSFLFCHCRNWRPSVRVWKGPDAWTILSGLPRVKEDLTLETEKPSTGSWKLLSSLLPTASHSCTPQPRSPLGSAKGNTRKAPTAHASEVCDQRSCHRFQVDHFFPLLYKTSEYFAYVGMAVVKLEK